MRKHLIALVIAVLCGVMLTACSGSGQASPAGLSGAYEKLCATDGLGGEEAFAYEEETDALIIEVDKVGDIDKLFEVLNKSVSGADIGVLCLHSVSEEHAEKINQGLAGLSCNSLQCLDMGASRDDGLSEALKTSDEWTELLTKTVALYDPNIYYFSGYGDDAKDNVGCVKAIWVDAAGTMEGENSLEMMSGVEELRFTAGITAEHREENELWGFRVGDRDRLLQNMPYMKSLSRVVVFPEKETWEAGETYCTFMLELQASGMELQTNEPEKGWDGSVDSLISVDDIDILSLNDGDKVKDMLDRTLGYVAEDAFETGKSFTQGEGMPTLDGTCLVYLGDPRESQWNDYDKLFSLTSIALLDDFEGTNVKTMRSAGEHFDYFVYVYPTFNLVGMYGDTTEAYDTQVNVRVYDMNNKVKYESGIITTVPAPTEYYYSGKPDERYWPNIDREAAVAYIVSLA